MMMGGNNRYSLDEINSADFESFCGIFENVVENCRLCANVLWAKRPFGTSQDILAAVCQFLEELTKSSKEGILRLYLDLAVSQRELTSDSYLERESAGLNNPDESYLRELTSLNDAYRSKFNFHFVICVRQTDQKGIFEAMKTRLGHSSEEEISVGIKEVIKISNLRILNIIKDPYKSNL